ncbi:ATP-binding protein [Ihubacter sp. rT4E-8]|uniref:ATP-binding protein n=1 Tax=Ihubacter sp. rT4E-8 TaxID=3242369 RepID=UPI003CFA248B
MKKTEENLSSIIEELIESRREDEWWDFKREHHHDKARLVHDITCMANSKANRDAYIIFGVEDETFNIIGVEHDEKRRNQQGIVDILRSVRYAGSVRPRIELRTIILEEHKVDVLIIKNTYDVPYYLEKPYQDSDVKGENGYKNGKTVRPFHIYTRVVDNNTEIDKNADLNDVEYLWRKRFGIDLSPKERLMRLLDDTDKWVFDWANKEYAYHIDFPEYQIVRSGEMQRECHPSAAFYMNPEMYTAPLNIMYHNTILHETQLWSFDEFRKYLPKASNCAVAGHRYGWYSFYLLDSIEGKLLRIFTCGNLDMTSREPDYHQLLLFQEAQEKEAFDQYLAEHFDDYSDDNILRQYQDQIEKDQISNSGGLLYSAFHVAKCAKLYEDWKKTI